MSTRDRALAIIAAALLGGAYGMVNGLDGGQVFALCALIWLCIYLAQKAAQRARRWRRGRL